MPIVPWPGDHVRVVEGMHEGQAALARQSCSACS